MRTPAFILAVVSTFLVTSAGAQDGRVQPGKDEVRQSTAKVKELQQERIAALKNVAEMQLSLSTVGKATPEGVLEAKVLVWEAELDAAEKESDRRTCLKNLVEVLKELEETAKARKRNAEGTEVGVLMAKARRLEAEIRLERSQAPAKTARLQP